MYCSFFPLFHGTLPKRLRLLALEIFNFVSSESFPFQEAIASIHFAFLAYQWLCPLQATLQQHSRISKRVVLVELLFIFF
jgi:hypothetical protein